MESLGLSGLCAQCGASLRTALVREVRHYEDTRLLQITCGVCEASFHAVDTGRPRSSDAIEVQDVLAAADALRNADRLSDLIDLDAA